MTNFRPNNYHRSRGRFLARPELWLLLLLLLLVSGGPVIEDFLGGAALSLAKPLWRLPEAADSSWSAALSLFLSKPELMQENSDLRSRLDLLEAQLARHQSTLEENQNLRELLGRLPEARQPLRLGRVLWGWRLGLFDLLTLDLGRENSGPGISAGDPVMAGENIWLGRIVAVHGRTSKVKLLSLAGEETPAMLGSERYPVMLRGRGGGNFIATLPRGLDVRAGQSVTVSGPDSDWLVALVGAVVNEPSRTEQVIYLRSPVDARRLKYVVVGQN